MKPVYIFSVVVIAAAGLTTACASKKDTGSASGGQPTRTIEIEMVDVAFKPASLEVKRNETVRFVFVNNGQMAHDAFVGDADAQADHEKEMQDDGNGDHGNDHRQGESDALTVKPGESGELIYTFHEQGKIEIGCHQPGHYESGMKVAVTVV